MAKLQYLNRKIEGIKLGRAVARDLLKRVPPGTQSKAAQRDPQVELDVSSKNITDEAVEHIAEALLTSISHPDKTTRLEELRLRDNQLTAGCLVALANVISSASPDLQDIDLGGNNITVATRNDELAWATFLSAIGSCTSLRRLDLSGNSLGPKAFEILARIYIKGTNARVQQTLRHPESSASGGIATLQDVRIAIEEQRSSIITYGTANLQEGDCGSPLQGAALENGALEVDGLTNLRSTAVTNLRSIPYVILSECRIDDACALSLSYLIESHPLVADLIGNVPVARPGDHARQIEEYNAVSGCNGIIWKPNPDLSEHGMKLLQLCEINREVRSETEDEDGGESSTELEDSHGTETGPLSAFPSSIRAMTITKKRLSSSSVLQGDAFEAMSGTVCEQILRATRSRIQGDILKSSGPCVHDLWKTALVILAMARAILLEHDVEQESVLHQADGPLTPGENQRPVTPTIREATTPYVRDFDADSPLNLPERTWASLGKTPAVITQSVRKATVFRLSLNSLGKSSLELELPCPRSQSSHPEPMASKTASAPASPASVHSTPSLYRCSGPKGLSLQLWGRILGLAFDADCLLSQKQLMNVIEYGGQRDTLRGEIGILGKPEHAQIWRALSNMGCLSYERE